MRARLKIICLSLVLLIVAVSLAGQAARKPFWFDEILTLRVADCGPTLEMWRAMTAGFEYNPPGPYLATQVSEKLFGRGPISSRLYALVSGVVVLLGVFVVASRSGGTAAGFLALFLLYVS